MNKDKLMEQWDTKNSIDRMALDIVRKGNQNKFFEKAEYVLLLACCYYVRQCFSSTDHCNLTMVQEIVNSSISHLDSLFEELRSNIVKMDLKETYYGSLAIKQYQLFVDSTKSREAVLLSVRLQLQKYLNPCSKVATSKGN